MRDNRDMVYSNYQAGGFAEPNMMPNMAPNMMPNMMPQGYNMSSNYQAYGPNVIPMNNMNGNNVMSNNENNTYIDEYDQRITKLERQIRRMDQRLRKLENGGVTGITDEEINIDNNLYMI